MKHTFALLALAAATQAIVLESHTKEETSEDPLSSLMLAVPGFGDITVASWTSYSVEG